MSYILKGSAWRKLEDDDYILRAMVVLCPSGVPPFGRQATADVLSTEEMRDILLVATHLRLKDLPKATP